jgi:hypothetical protein
MYAFLPKSLLPVYLMHLVLLGSSCFLARLVQLLYQKLQRYLSYWPLECLLSHLDRFPLATGLQTKQTHPPHLHLEFFVQLWSHHAELLLVRAASLRPGRRPVLLELLNGLKVKIS